MTQRIDGKRIEPQPSQRGGQRHGGNAGTQSGIDHQCGQQVDLRADKIAQGANVRFKEDRQEGDQQNGDGVKPIHLRDA